MLLHFQIPKREFPRHARESWVSSASQPEGFLVWVYSRGAARYGQKKDDTRVGYDDRQSQNPLRPNADNVVHMSRPAFALWDGH